MAYTKSMAELFDVNVPAITGKTAPKTVYTATDSLKEPFQATLTISRI